MRRQITSRNAPRRLRRRLWAYLQVNCLGRHRQSLAFLLFTGKGSMRKKEA